MSKIYESHLEETVINLLEQHSYKYLLPVDQEKERQTLDNVVLKNRLKNAIDSLNPTIPAIARDYAFKQVINLPTLSLIETNESFHRLLTEGVPVEYQKDGDTVGGEVKLVDFKNLDNNDYVVTNQFTINENNVIKRPDVVLLINGLPLVVIELKNPVDENATVKKAYTQLQNYKNAIPSLFAYNGILVASDGLDAKAGSLTSGWSRFMNWKTVDGVKEDSITTPQIETMIKGMLRPDVLLDLIKQFTVFEKAKKEDKTTGLVKVSSIKKIAAYHQYHAVNQAIISTIRASARGPLMLRENPVSYGLPSVKQQTKGDQRAGVIWHTQGSGKSLSMVFYAGKLVIAPEMKNPTLVIITDRNDLDDQLFETFANSKQLLRQDPVQALNRGHLRELLETSGGGIVFTTIQKFSAEKNATTYNLLSSRKNIIVIADEAHRSQYGFGAKTSFVTNDNNEQEAITRYGFAKYLRDGLPNASFIGFTGTPIEKTDASTLSVFGNYVDIYDIAQAVEDGSTVRIYYESRLAKIHLKEDQKKKLDEEVEAVTQGEESTASEKSKAKWTQLEAIVGHKERLRDIAKDVVTHFETRQLVFDGKALFVSMSRRIAVELYEEIIKLRPNWHSNDITKGVIKVVMTSSSSDPENWQKHHTTKQQRKDLGDRLKDENDELKIVIVRDMWLTGFDAPCVKTMYIDKPMRGHNLMQAIARVNRVYKDVEGGLIVDYIGIASDLKYALATYTESGGEGKPTLSQEDAVMAMLEKYEIVSQMFAHFGVERYFVDDTREKMVIILEAQEHVLGLEDGKSRFIKYVDMLAKAFALSVPNIKAMEIKDEVGFYQAVKARLVKYEPQGFGKSDDEIETAIRQIIDKAVVSDGVIDVFDAAGIKKPDISILSDEFMAEIQGMKQKNVALELLKKLLGDEIKTRSKKNFIQSKKLSEMLENSIRKYQNNLITAAQVIDEMIKLAKEIKNHDKRGEDLGLNNDEIAFYDALADNMSATDILGDDQLREISRILVKKVKANTSIDWTIKENVQAKLRVAIKRVLRQYGYPPDMEKIATENILKQAELLADEWATE